MVVGRSWRRTLEGAGTGVEKASLLLHQIKKGSVGLPTILVMRIAVHCVLYSVAGIVACVDCLHMNEYKQYFKSS